MRVVIERAIPEAEYVAHEAELVRAREDMLQAEDDLFVAELEAEHWAWRAERPCDDLWPEADLRAVEARQIVYSVQGRVNEARDRLEKLQWEHDRLVIAQPEEHEDAVSEPALHG